MNELTLPSFEMDCRDWVVVTPEQAGLSDDVDGSPVLAVLSTVVLGAESFTPASAVFTIGVVDDDVPAALPLSDGGVAAELVDPDADEFGMRFMMQAPSSSLALVAEFSMPNGREPEVVERVEELMRSFKWAA